MMYNSALMNWLPSYLIREGGMEISAASNVAAFILLSQVVGVGCIGPVIDFLRRYRKKRGPHWR